MEEVGVEETAVEDRDPAVHTIRIETVEIVADIDQEEMIRDPVAITAGGKLTGTVTADIGLEEKMKVIAMAVIDQEEAMMINLDRVAIDPEGMISEGVRMVAIDPDAKVEMVAMAAQIRDRAMVTNPAKTAGQEGQEQIQASSFL